ncbi:MAG: CPBP family intramembrane metalloprotease [Alphaproteobacteria bacterium]|nr:CPBP family intramembrane metalloprotease [Alphaproteobacteria bacterium]
MLDKLGLGLSVSWPLTIGLAVVWTALMVAFTPVADWIATRLVATPPTLGAFKALRESRWKLVLGIVIAWVLGGFLEELLLRGIILKITQAALTWPLGVFAASVVGICLAALVAFVLHLYQGLRAALIVTQLSVLFGALFVISGHNLWSVILAHGFYDTIAFIRFANKQSKYSDLGEPSL